MTCRSCVSCPYASRLPPAIAGVMLDPIARELQFDGRQQVLSAHEAKLLEAMLRAQGRPVQHDHLIGAVWAGSAEPEHAMISIRLYVGKLRKRLRALAAPLIIQTIAGTGYRLQLGG